ncbi:efflux transporter outer membrane subunit [Caenimonas aquaedulcis]|uniref:Efflux transporter outer membrane subunit n=1 Tax=Caenimonas aquaedulcis TaxID=2793270 RepID=A0A931MJ20_9BURK|nr:efflux transporter outer membrane subunit [Caenimonas aquaedulcis]MBG9389855.1 efflux transporter outer membrane subunit [Caenimonas aquaedulcis]
MSWRLAWVAAAAALSACAAGPAYQRPALDMPAAWKVEAPWQEARPQDAAVRGPWWKRFGDAQLDALQEQALAASPTLAAAVARLAQARAAADASSAGLFPQLSLGGRVQRQKSSENRPLSNYNSPNFSTVQNDFALSFNVAYEADLWGRVRSSVDAARATAEQSAADLQNVRLVLASDLAANYFNLRELDIELDVLAQSIALQRKALELATARHDLGATSGLDVAQQQALLDSTLTQVDVLRRQRAQFENAIAALTGRPAQLFSLAPEASARTAPPVPLGVPADVLQRRPDVAAAERAMAAANAQIGVARAAYYPNITLGPSLGVDSRALSTLFDAPSLLWSLGVSIAQPLFDAGRTDANVAMAEAGYQLTVANYRRTVLVAMQEVQDGISGSAALDRALAQARLAEQSARRVLQLATDRYEGGVATYLDVITAQQSLLTSQRQLAQLQGQRMLVAVLLVKALGGDWQ